MQIKITKLKEADDPRHPNNIEIGFEQTFTISPEFFEKPTEGKTFWPSLNWRTSVVQKIIDENTFETYNSIYRWKILDE